MSKVTADDFALFVPGCGRDEDCASDDEDRSDKEDDGGDEEIEVIEVGEQRPANPFGFREDERMQRTACRQLEEAIALLPAEYKSSYVKAKDVSPSLIWEESNPMRFLRFDSFNHWAAARRITTYWSIREEIFGREHAFRPLNLYDQEVFGQENPIEDFFETESVLLLPPDNKGRGTVYVERSKMSRPDEVRLRTAFLVFHMLAQSDVSEFVVLVKLQNPFDAMFQKRIVRLVSDLALNALPIHRERVHLICNPPRKEASVARKFLDQIVPLALRRLGGYFGKAPIVHVVDSPEEILAALRPYGWKPEGLPPALGGSWDPRRWFDKYQCPPSNAEVARDAVPTAAAAGAAAEERDTKPSPTPSGKHVGAAKAASPKDDGSSVRGLDVSSSSPQGTAAAATAKRCEGNE